MAYFNGFSMAACGAAALTLLAACGGQTDSAGNKNGEKVATADDCVPIGENGRYYVVQNGKLLPTTAPEPETKVVPAPIGWAREVENTFPGNGFPWLGLNARGASNNVVTLTGLAPTTESRDKAFAFGERAIKALPQGKDMVVVNGIKVEGGEEAVGQALEELGETGLSLSDCQDAFTKTMQGRNVEFRTASATIRGDSAQLLDAVTGVALLCNAYAVEIGGHTDAIGSETMNQALSERRAQAVRTYLINRGVPPNQLTAVGYGESQPLDEGTTRDALARNRRTEFKVSEGN